jgi:hypothetical protein
MRYAKALALAFIAMVALGAGAATAASADDLTAEKYPGDADREQRSWVFG